MLNLNLNLNAQRLLASAYDQAASLRVARSHIAGATVLDAGVHCCGSLAAGVLLARLCLADRAHVSIVPGPRDTQESAGATDWGCDAEVFVQTDCPLAACLGSQYAGWPVSCGDYFAMASGPMRLLRVREEMLQHLGLSEQADHAVGVLESDTLPSPETIEQIAEQCHVSTGQLSLAVAPSTSLAGTVQVVARCIETAMHKLHALEFDVTSIQSAIGSAPLAPPAKRGKTVQGIGRTNDAILYGGRVTFWTDADDEAIEAVVNKVPSRSSKDYGRPFADVFKDYNYDFYQVDPLLFSPAVVTIHNLRSGRTWRAGQINPDVLKQSFLG